MTGIQALLAAVAARDPNDAEQSLSVVALAVDVARELKLAPEQVERVSHVALLREVGKIGIPERILQKKGRLEPEEWQQVRQHPKIGEQVVASIDGLAHLAPYVRAVYERWDGAGYPDGLVGERIPIESRITLACDAFHSMTCDRPYRPALSDEAAREALSANAGTQFCPEVTNAALVVLYREAVKEQERASMVESAEALEVTRSERSGRRRVWRSRVAPRTLWIASLVAGIPLGAWLALPLRDVSGVCPAQRDGFFYCELQKAWAPALTKFLLAPVVVLLLARFLFFTLLPLYDRWRHGELRRRPARGTRPDPLLLAATWGMAADPPEEETPAEAPDPPSLFPPPIPMPPLTASARRAPRPQ